MKGDLAASKKEQLLIELVLTKQAKIARLEEEIQTKLKGMAIVNSAD